MTSILQDQYKSVFTTPKPQYDHPDPDESHFPVHLDDIDFTEEAFIREINTLSANSAAGPDGFPSILLKKIACSLLNHYVLSGATSLTKVTHQSYSKQALLRPFSRKVTKVYLRTTGLLP